jgi:hypothetical protein
MHEDDYRRALADPAAHFTDPEALLRHESLNQEQKRALLERWRSHGGEKNTLPRGLLERLGRALAFLDTETGERVQTHEHVLHGPGTAPDSSQQPEDDRRKEEGQR